MTRAALLLVAACGAAPAAAVDPVVTKVPVAPAPKPAGNLRGRLLLDGKPVRYFGITYTPDAMFAGVYSKAIAVHATKDGEFAANVPEGHWDLIVAAPGAMRRVLAGIDVGASSDLGVVSLQHGHTIDGVVRDENGDAVAGARVDYIAQHTFAQTDELDDLALGNVSTRTDDEGRYTLRDVPHEGRLPDRPVIVASTADRASLPTDARTSSGSVDLTLSPSGAISVIVAGGQAVLATAMPAGQRTRLLARRADGGWRFDRVPAGTYSVEVHGPRLLTSVDRTVTVHAGATEEVTVALPELPPIAVEITSTKSPCAEIQLRDMTMTDVATAPCENGRAAFPKLQPGNYLACIDRHDCMPIEVLPKPAQQTFEIPRE